MKSYPLIAVIASLMAPAAAGEHAVVVTFDQEAADRNDWGSLQPMDPQGWRLTAPGTGCPAHPQGRALDASSPDPPEARVLAFPLPTEADLRQGTVEMWFKPHWPMGAREGHTLFHLKLRGGYWNGLWLGYHGTITPTTEAFGANIMDGLDHPAYVDDAEAQLGWKAGEWHHIACTWTDHSLWVFADGRWVAQTLCEMPFQIKENEGRICLGGTFGLGETRPLAGGWIDEFRFVDLPLYSPDHPPEPMRRVTTELDLGLAGPGSGTTATADSTSPPQALTLDVPQLHDGQYEGVVQVGSGEGKEWVVVHLPEETEVSSLEWSRDGVPYGGEQGRGWAFVLPYPRAFSIEVSRDGENWETVVEEPDFHITPQFVAHSEALRFRHHFPPRQARQIRMTIHQRPRSYQFILLDEVAVYTPDGCNLARQARVETGAFGGVVRRYDPSLALDGRWGEESCWKSAVPGKGVLTVEFPAPLEVHQVTFSRSREGLKQDGTPSAGRIEVSLDGQTWKAVGEFQGAEPKPRSIAFPPRQAKGVRLVIMETVDGKEAVIDDLRVD